MNERLAFFTQHTDKKNLSSIIRLGFDENKEQPFKLSLDLLCIYC